MANYVVTTKEVYDADETNNGIVVKVKGSLKEYQKVVSVGPMVRNVQAGELVCINPKRYARHKHQAGSLKDGVITDNPVIAYEFNIIEMDNEQYLLLTDQDIDFVIEEWEEVPNNPIVIPHKEIIV